MFMIVEDKITEFKNSIDFRNIHVQISNSLEQCNSQCINWLKHNNYYQFLKKADISKGTNCNVSQSIYYGIDYTFFEDEIDEFKGNWIGCSISFSTRKDLLNITLIIHSIYQEKILIDFTFDVTFSKEIRRLKEALDVNLAKVPVLLIECLEDFFKTYFSSHE
jgi:hypothetical protein